MKRPVNLMFLIFAVALTAPPATARGQENLLDAINKGESRSVRSVVQELGTSLTRTETKVNKRQTRGYQKHMLENGDMLLDQVRRTREGSTVVTRTHIQRQPDGRHRAHHLFSTVLKDRAATGYAGGSMLHVGSSGFGGFMGRVDIQHLTSAKNARESLQTLNRGMQTADSRMKDVTYGWKPLGRLAKTIAGWNARHKMPRSWRRAQRRASKRTIGRR